MILGVTAVRPSVRAPPNAIFLSIIVLLSALNGWLVGWLVGGTLCRHFYFPRRNGRVGSRMGSRALRPFPTLQTPAAATVQLSGNREED